MQKNMKTTTHNEEKNPSIETNPELTQIQEWVHKIIKTISITAFQMWKELSGDICKVY